MSSKFKLISRGNLYLFPASVEDLLPQNHIARFIVEVLQAIDLSAIEKNILTEEQKPIQLTLC